MVDRRHVHDRSLEPETDDRLAQLLAVHRRREGPAGSDEDRVWQRVHGSILALPAAGEILARAGDAAAGSGAPGAGVAGSAAVGSAGTGAKLSTAAASAKAVGAVQLGATAGKATTLVTVLGWVGAGTGVGAAAIAVAVTVTSPRAESPQPASTVTVQEASANPSHANRAHGPVLADPEPELNPPAALVEPAEGASSMPDEPGVADRPLVKSADNSVHGEGAQLRVRESEVPRASTRARSSRKPRARRDTPPANPRPGADLAAEVDALAQIDGLVRAGRGAAALSAIAEFRRDHPSTALARELRGLTVLARCLAEPHSEAVRRQAAEQLAAGRLRKFARRLRDVCRLPGALR